MRRLFFPAFPEEAARRQAAALLARCQALAERYGVSSKRVLTREHAAGQAVVQAAERCGASLVVMASEQRFSRAGRLRLDSTATYVLKHADCRVIVISAQEAISHPVKQVA